MSSNSKSVPNGTFDTNFLGHVQTEQLLAKNFDKLDDMLGVPAGGLTADDVGKVLAVVEREDGSYGFSLVDAATL